MATSMARVEANQRNALRSTGPQTAAGKAVSRLNAFQHGGAGQGDLLGPGEDHALVAHRAEAFARELRATGAMGHLLAHRAALLSVRIENLAAGELMAIHAADQRGRAEFDANRDEAIAELLALAAAPGADPTEALAALAEAPDGLARLVAAWDDLRVQLESADPGRAAEVATRWLGAVGVAAGAGASEPLPPGDLARRVAAEVARLEAQATRLVGLAAGIDQARINAGIRARFDPSPAATLARRYEAAAERGMYRAIRAIADLNRQAGRTDGEAVLATGQSMVTPPGFPPPPPPPPTPRPVAVVPSLASFGAVEAEPMASFRAGVDPARHVPVHLDPASPAARRQRPDPHRLARRAAAHR